MRLANVDELDQIYDLYNTVIEHVNQTDIKLGWNIEIYPDKSFIKESIDNGEMLVELLNDEIIAVAVVNHNVNPEYDDINWGIKGPKSKIATIHALAVHPDKRGKLISDKFLAQIEAYCKKQGDEAIHLDVIDTNIPAYKLYLRNGYAEIDCIKMYYEVVGTREFWMLERVFK